jgi:4-hydroxy-tetrahydrodipicolinate synthase
MAVALPQGVYTALVTPLTATGEVDYPAFSVLVDWQRAHGVAGVVVSGTTGEAASLSVAEREQVIATVRKCTPDLKVIAGTGCSNLPETIHLSRFAQQHGCDAIVVIPPFYYKNVPEEGVVAYYAQVLESVEIPVLLYNYPELAGIEMTPTVVEALLEYPHLLGVKDSSGSWETVLSFLRRFPRLQVFVGAEKLYSRALMSGAAGCISGLANAFPDLMVQIDAAVRRGEDTALLDKQLCAVLQAVDAVSFIPAIKQICAWRDLPSMWVRPPLRELSPLQAERLRGTLQSMEVL